ncbi:MAG: aldehyde ferredoxin oxidoreductase [Rhodospirillaceae bacterium]|nr:aldehyde ferredoxin oxidoreductase [Rhodospirillaceae bacterium]
MRKYLNIDLTKQSTDTIEFSGEQAARAGRHHIASTLLDMGVAKVDPLSADNPLIFSAGPFAGTNFSNANRLSVGCKSPLTGGIKEANSGGTFALAMGHLEISGFTLHGNSPEWTIIRITKDGAVTFEDATAYLGKGNKEAARMLFEAYGDKVSLGICGPVGEYGGLLAGIAFTDPDGRPDRFAGRGGVGAVMGTKKIKAIVIDKLKLPPLHDRKKVITAVREYGKMLDEQPAVQNMKALGTAMVGDFTNHIGGLPVNNFSRGSQVDDGLETFTMGGQHIRDVNVARGGDPSHACMPGCQIKCSNIYFSADGEELVSPLEYETLGLMGTNCGLTNPDDLAILNATANDLGIDTIEVGAMLGMLMELGQAPFGDVDFMAVALSDIAKGNERGRLLAQGTARVGAHYGAKRVPVIKGQALSAYDPRVIEVTGISMMVTAQGADHTAGNIPAFECAGKSVEELAEASYTIQVHSATADSLGMCLFGRSVTNEKQEFIVDAINAALGTKFDTAFFEQLGHDVLVMERRFNEAAGFTEDDDELPAFFRDEPLPPTGKVARLKAEEVNRHINARLAQTTG